MNDDQKGVVEFGLDAEGMVARAWKIFLTRPLTLLGVSCLVQICWLPAHLLALPSIFWLPFTLCVPFATVQLLRGEKTDRLFLGWIELYPRVLMVFVPAAISFIVLYVISGFVQFYLVQLFSEGLTNRLMFSLYVGRFFLPVLAESILGHMVALAALLAVRKKLSATEAWLELFSTRRQVLETFLLGGMLALFGMSGLVVCCVGTFATTTFAWICLGVAYYQIFEQ
ncbi:MAG: hypothetical protein KJ050_15135 [Candidatus Omnitrophica bacterium]|nr:hypothetical protein [bacterium]MBK7494244.1 hypothetical protein [Candidatus Omnitrophota bacterium]MCE7907274.1 hypothetical protein [Candidatus Omnitrophica bacterium COP1]MBV6480841.1 hypothetical protein [bacterium]MCC6732272.1 hypothetical protein [Candidatus Omnitrophota bacterium]